MRHDLVRQPVGTDVFDSGHLAHRIVGIRSGVSRGLYRTNRTRACSLRVACCAAIDRWRKRHSARAAALPSLVPSPIQNDSGLPQGHSGPLRAQSAHQTACAKGRNIMMHPCSPISRSLAVPGIGFCQNISAGSDVPEFAALRSWSSTARGKQVANATDRHRPWGADPACDRLQTAVN
jgi:hypothetical protein